MLGQGGFTQPSFALNEQGPVPLGDQGGEIGDRPLTTHKAEIGRGHGHDHERLFVGGGLGYPAGDIGAHPVQRPFQRRLEGGLGHLFARYPRQQPPHLVGHILNMAFGVAGGVGNIQVLLPLPYLAQNGALQIVQVPPSDGKNEPVCQFYCL